MSVKIYNSQFIGDKKLREYNPFAEEYFSGTDIKLVANDIEIKQISMVQYELQEQLKPIYGYNSYVYDDIAVGSRIVTGTFVCPMKNLADNEEFDCVPESKILNEGESVDIVTGGESEPDKDYEEYVNDSKVYLSPFSDLNIFDIKEDTVIVKNQTSDYKYIYHPSSNKFGYIKVGG